MQGQGQQATENQRMEAAYRRGCHQALALTLARARELKLGPVETVILFEMVAEIVSDLRRSPAELRYFMHEAFKKLDALDDGYHPTIDRAPA